MCRGTTTIITSADHHTYYQSDTLFHFGKMCQKYHGVDQARTQPWGFGVQTPPPPPPPLWLCQFFIFYLLVTPEVGLVDGRYPYPIM